MKALIEIQHELKAPKNQRNTFGKYNFRSCEDILEAVKPILKTHNAILTISDDIREIGGILFVNATATIKIGEESVSVTAQAGIDPNRKGMDISQSFGSSSSYARKYALNGLFLIDDTKDADATNKHGKEDNTTQNDNQLSAKDVEGIVKECKTIAELTEYYNANKNALSNNAVLMALLATRRKELQS